MGIKFGTCIVLKSCQQNQWQFQMKMEMGAHLRKVHGIDVVLPRGLKIEEEEHLTLGKTLSSKLMELA